MKKEKSKKIRTKRQAKTVSFRKKTTIYQFFSFLIYKFLFPLSKSPELHVQ